jgi:hypothetical protein
VERQPRTRQWLASAVLALGAGVVGYGLAANRVVPSAPEPEVGRSSSSYGHLGEGGSLFYRWVSPLDPPPLARETALLTPFSREEECTEACPPGLLVVDGERGRQKIARLLASLEPALAALTTDSRLPGEFRAAVVRRLARHARAPGLGSPPLRVFGMAEPRSDLGGESESQVLVSLAVYDSRDPFFDARRVHPGGGGVLMIARREESSLPEEPPSVARVVEGFVEVAEPGPTMRLPPREDSALSRTYPSGMRHFGEVGDVHGVHLDEDGRLSAYDESFRERALPSPADLVALVRFVISRA